MSEAAARPARLRGDLTQSQSAMADVSSKEALLFEKRSKNFWLFGVRVGATLIYYERKFFGSFSQKRTAGFLTSASLPALPA